MKWIFPVIMFLLLAFDCSERRNIMAHRTIPAYLTQESSWADSVIDQLSLREKIGQLFMVAAYSNRDEKHLRELEELVTKYNIGGLIFFQGGPIRQAKMTNHLQALSGVPLWLGMDAEWGLAMRLDSTIEYPRQMTLGAIQDSSIVYEFGEEMARQLKRMGVHVSFSPVVDINSNPRNPVIGNRSFGSSSKVVQKLGIAYMKGLQDNGIMANAKHFPGHGDTDSDSHKTLPTLNHSYERLDSLELAPFKALINQGVGSVMVAHLNIPVLDSGANKASTLSRNIVHNLLRDSLGFKGLSFTDALNMKGVSNYFEPGELDLLALQAGNDVLLFPEDVPKAIDRIELAVNDSLISLEDIDKHCLKILRAKEWLRVHEQDSIKIQGLFEDLNSPQAKAVKKKVIEAAITLLKNSDGDLPLIAREESTAILNIGKDAEAFNQNFTESYNAQTFRLNHSMNFAGLQKTIKELSEYDRVIINVFGTSQRPSRKYGITYNSAKLVRDLCSNTKAHVNIFANAYVLRYLDGIQNAHSLLVAYQNDDMTQESVAEVLLGAISARGRLPVQVNNKFRQGAGIDQSKIIRLRKCLPEMTGLKSSDFHSIDSIALAGIKAQAYPGCQIRVIKGNNIIYSKNFGHHTYEEKQAVNDGSIYDLASITKMVASTAAMMKLHEDGAINITHSLCDYLDICDTSEYYQINLMEMMSHTARLRSWIPFYLETIEKGKLNQSIYQTAPSEGFCTQVAEGLYICDTYADTLKNTILTAPLRSEREYKYSDLGYYFVKDIIERKTNSQLEDYVDSLFYKPLGLKTMGYLPLRTHHIDEIVPTEYDLQYRKQLIRGYVHDPGAAMLGGVGGHAGVFSNADDLARIMFMFMNDGSYAGKSYFQPETIEYFSTCHFCEEDNRRGIGFDKPSTKLDSGPTCNSASSSSYGHSGFTGTLAWADPKHDIVYVFLSNRVYPDAANRKLLEMDIRTNIQQVIYDAYSIPHRAEENSSLSDRK